MTKDEFNNALYSVNTKVKARGGWQVYGILGMDFGRGMLLIRPLGKTEPEWWPFEPFEFVDPAPHTEGKEK